MGILDYAFAGCSELTEIILPDSVTNIGEYAFAFCTGLTEIVLPDGVTDIGEGAFAACAGLTEVELPNAIADIAGYTFSGCVNLTDVSLPEGLLNIGEAAFESCSALQEVAIPNNVKSIAANAFSGCTKLSSVTLPGSLESIGEYAFSSCTALSSITIPDSVTEIGDYAFFQAGIKSVLFEGNPDMTFMEALLLYDRHTFAGTNLFNDVLPSSGSTSTDGTSPISLVCRLIARNLIENGEISNLKDAYDWICKNCDYTYSTGAHYSYADGPFFYGVASCQGYALAMKAYLDEMNYPNFILTGKATGTWTQAI
ncbi:MAG: leucine-rich repeat domain-containing protein [Oscillospiraceae bacterium]|nr:leucine-rich repeat domain-containing protein [Oscillospiraceae bacterium]